MKQEDIEKLKEICKKEGLYFDFDHIDGSALIVREKKKVDFIGWDYGDKECTYQFNFQFHKSLFKVIKPKDLGRILEDFISRNALI